MPTIHAAPHLAQLDDAQRPTLAPLIDKIDSASLNLVAGTFQEPREIGREIAINLALQAMVDDDDAGNIPGAIAAWNLLIRLVRSRSVAAVARLERERGLERGS